MLPALPLAVVKHAIREQHIYTTGLCKQDHATHAKMADTNRPFAAMTTSRDTINPLRPYYIPPSIGVPPPNTSTAAAAAQRTSGIGRSARDLLSDFDYTGQLLDTDGASFTELGRKLFDKAVWKYTSVLLAQPFDVAKTLLQLRLAGSGVDVAYAHNHGADRTRYPLTLSGSESEDDDDDDEPSYFTPTRPPNRSLRGEDETPTRRTRRRRRGDTASSATSIPASSTHRSQNDMTHRLDIRKPDSVMDVLSQLWQHSGATGLWKATNATFVYNVLAKAIEGFTRGLLCAILNLPDPTALAGGPSEFVASAMGAMNIADSPSPLASLAVSVAAVGITGVLLSPLDLVRTRSVGNMSFCVYGLICTVQADCDADDIISARDITAHQTVAFFYSEYDFASNHASTLFPSDADHIYHSARPTAISAHRPSADAFSLLFVLVRSQYCRTLAKASSRDCASALSGPCIAPATRPRFEETPLRYSQFQF